MINNAPSRTVKGAILALLFPAASLAQVTYGTDALPLTDSFRLGGLCELSSGPVWTGIETSGLADDDLALLLYLSDGSTLYSHSVTGGVFAPTTIGTMTLTGSTNAITMPGLAFTAGTLYGSHDTLHTEGVYSIDLVTLDATLVAAYTDNQIMVGGLDVDPATGLLWGTNDSDTYTDPAGAMGRGIVVIDVIAPTETLVAPYPMGVDDVDGLAFEPGGTGLVYLIEDEPSPLHTFDVGAMAYDVTPPIGGFTASGLTAGGTFIEGPVPLLPNYCTAEPNSTGSPSTMGATGSTLAADNNLTLCTTGLPPNQFGIYIGSSEQGFVPMVGGVSNGNLCVQGVIGRFPQVLDSGASGAFSLRIDLTAIPAGPSTVSMTAGTTWNFQAWHRDSVGLGSNLSDGIEINFN